ncbi:unnamed protein product [Effrenium voratum]|nr:unnamed protein product [Effrenium voratum]
MEILWKSEKQQHGDMFCSGSLTAAIFCDRQRDGAMVLETIIPLRMVLGAEDVLSLWFWGIFFSKMLKLRSSKAKQDVEVVSTKGQDFHTIQGAPADLSWRGALPCYLLPVGFCVEAVRFHLRHVSGSRAVLRLWRLLVSVFCVLPCFELMVAHDWSNPLTAQIQHGALKDLRFRMSLYFWTAAEFLTTLNFTRLACGANKLSFQKRVALSMILGFLNGGIGITVAHELLHKPRWLDKLLAHGLLTNQCYLHWADEHVTGHHQKVATPEDPATSRKGESFYRFLPRTLLGSFRSAWQAFQERQRRGGKAASLGLFALRSFGPSALWAVLLAQVTRRRLKRVLPFFLLQSMVGITLLEAVNYIEHYGLQRRKLPDGKYERVTPRHSWNSAHQLSNLILFKLQRHSDHHTFPQRPFQLLRNFEESPQLPTGYFGMVLLAFFPPAFFWIMDPLVDAHNKNADEDETRVVQASAEKRFGRWALLVLAASLLAQKSVLG